MKVAANNIPLELRSIPQWVAWYFGRPKANGKPPKIPANPHNGNEAKANEPKTWGTYDVAMIAKERHKWDGVGFVFTEDAGFTGIDFDDCIIGGVLNPEAAAEVRALNSYTEVSPSGGGVKVIVRGRKPVGTGCKVQKVHGCSRVEVYDRARFFTVTGRRLQGTPATVEDRQAQVTALCAKLWPRRPKQAAPMTAAGKPVVGGDNRVEWCRKYLVKIDDAVSGQGGSNQTLYAACLCFRFALSDTNALATLQWFNETKCKPVWSDKELAHKLADGKKKVEADGTFGVLLRKGRSAHWNTGVALAEAVEGKPKVRDCELWHNALPAWIRNLERPKLRLYQMAILQAIANRCSATPIDAHGSLGYAIIGYEKLAKEARMGTRTAIGHVQRLMTMGLLAKVETGGGVNPRTGEVTSNVYAIPGDEGIEVRREYANPAYHHPPPLAY